MRAIINGRILTESGMVEGKELLYDERVQGIVPPDTAENTEVIDAKGLILAPGLIDLHIHGSAGDDASDGDEGGLRRIAESLLSSGVTGFLPTTMTLPWPVIERAIGAVRRMMPKSREKGFMGSQILGCHAEGPFINPKMKGAQAEAHILPPSAEKILPHKDTLRLLTMAPEMPGGMAAIQDLASKSDILISIGHSDASFEEASAAIQAGARHVTHLFNAMSPLHHRAPGVVGAALSCPDVSCEVIADGIHVHPALFPMLHRLKRDKLILVTDCTRAGGMADGEYSLGGQQITVKGAECRLKDGTIAGSVLRLNQAVRRLFEQGGISLTDAIHAASLNPARAIGISQRKGSILPGKDADFILMDDDFDVKATIIGGVTKYRKG